MFPCASSHLSTDYRGSVLRYSTQINTINSIFTIKAAGNYQFIVKMIISIGGAVLWGNSGFE